MKKSLKTFLVAAALTVTLAACSTMFGNPHLARNAAAPQSDRTATKALSTEVGRQHLDVGRNGLAIEAFEAALATGEPPAPAYNGLGVAYARLGRFDLAERYFRVAMTLAPGDERYPANLARLQTSPAFAMRHEGDMGTALAAQQADPVGLPEARRADATPIAPRRLQRQGGNQYFIHATEPMAAPPRTAAMTVDRRFKALFRMQLPQPTESGDRAVEGKMDLPPQPRVIRFTPLVRMTLPPVRD